MSTRFAITVDFSLKSADAMPEFRRLIDANAAASCQHEPGCQRFDVLVPDGTVDQILLYEIYDDRAAFEAHLRTDHYLQFDAASEPIVNTKQIKEQTLVYEGSAAPKN